MRILARQGETIPVLQVIGYIGDSASETAPGAASAVAPSSPAAVTAPAQSAVESVGGAASGAAVPIQDSPVAPALPVGQPEDDAPIRVTPAARRVARERGIDLSEIRRLKGSGPAGRVIEADVVRYAEARLVAPAAPAAVAAPAAPQAAVAAPAPSAQAAAGDWDLIPLTRIRQITADRLSQSYREAVHVTLHADFDMGEAGKLRAQLIQEWEPKHGIRVTFTDLIVRACAKALAEHRGVNSSYTPEGIRQHRRVNVGVAASVATGLVVPVVRDADQLSLLEIAKAVRGYTERARAGQLTPDEMKGGTFTVTNMGTMGVDHFTPIINTGEGAILGVGAIAERPVVRDGLVVARPTMPASLSFDHRLVDGAGAATFLARVKQILESPFLVLI